MANFKATRYWQDPVEAEVIYKLELKKASKYDDLHRGIDAYDMDGNSIQIKSTPIAKRTGKLAWETRVKDRQLGMWVASNYTKDEAEFYIFAVGVNLYLVSSQELHAYVECNGWEAVKTLTPERIANQARIGHRHEDAEVGILNIDTLLKHRIAHLLSHQLEVGN